MAEELVFSVNETEAERATPISLAEAGFKERTHLQEWVRKNPQILGAGVRIVTFEFDRWRAGDSRATDRLDLLGLDEDGRLVVAELKRGPAPDTTEMQAIKYAAYTSRFTPATLAERHAEYLNNVRATGAAAVSVEEATGLLDEHAGGALDPELLRKPRIVLVAASFPPQVTASAVWLTEMGVSVTMVEFNAYRTEHDTVLTVSQTWPIADVEDFTVSPREAEHRDAVERVRGRRETNAVVTLVAEGTLEDGCVLTLDVDTLPTTVREQAETWIAQDRARGRASWRNVRGRPLVWEADGEAWSPTGLAREIIERSGGERVSLAGPRVWRTEGGDTLAALAGFGGGGRRDWSDLHGLLDQLRAGEWTTYGDLAGAIGTAPQPLGNHVTECDNCHNAWRVLNFDSRVADNFRWGDPSDTRDPIDVLTKEGVTFVDGRASPTQRVDAEMLRQRR